MDIKSTQLDNLKKKQTQLNARIQALEAAEKSRERKRETRRKILVGAYYLDQAKNENKFDEIKKCMADYLTRNSDRILFDLEPIKTRVSTE